MLTDMPYKITNATPFNLILSLHGQLQLPSWELFLHPDLIHVDSSHVHVFLNNRIRLRTLSQAMAPQLF